MSEIADQLIDVALARPDLQPLCAGVMRDVLALRELNGEQLKTIEAARDSLVAEIRKEIDDLKTEIAFLELQLGGADG